MFRSSKSGVKWSCPSSRITSQGSAVTSPKTQTMVGRNIFVAHTYLIPISASNGNVTIREKRAVALVLGLAGLGAAFVSLAWASLQQVDISRHNAQLRVADEMNKNHRESAEISAKMLDILTRYTG